MKVAVTKSVVCVAVALVMACSLFNKSNEMYDVELCDCDADCECQAACDCDPDCDSTHCECDTSTTCNAPCDCDPECRPPEWCEEYNLEEKCLCDNTSVCDNKRCLCDPECYDL